MSYTAATIPDFRARFPTGFDQVSDDLVTMALTRGLRMVDETWFEDDYQEGQLLYSAHWLALNGNGTTPDTTGGLSNFSQIRSGQLSLTRKPGSEIAGSDTVDGSTSYGRQYTALMNRNRAPRGTVAAGIADEVYSPWYVAPFNGGFGS